MCVRYFVRICSAKVELTAREFWHSFPLFTGLHYEESEDGKTAKVTADMEVREGDEE